MKRWANSFIIVILTIITVAAMYKFKYSYVKSVNSMVPSETNDIGKPSGTGYIFDDLGMEINIENKDENVKTDIDM